MLLIAPDVNSEGIRMFIPIVTVSHSSYSIAKFSLFTLVRRSSAVDLIYSPKYECMYYSFHVRSVACPHCSVSGNHSYVTLTTYNVTILQ
jgi:hypothetical protein